MYDDLAELIAIDSTMGESAPDAPFGTGPKAALDWFLRKAESYGLKVGSLAGKVGWAEYGEGKEMIGLLGHLDVVPAGKGWSYDPYRLTLENGKAYGRGVADDKGPAVACLHVLKRLKDEAKKLNKRVRLIVGTNEENGSECMKYYRLNGELPTVSIVPDADFPIINSEKGILTVRVTVPAGQSFDRSISSLSGGLRSNMVPAEAYITVPVDSPLYNAMLTNSGALDAGVFAMSPAAENIYSAGYKPSDYSIENLGNEIRITAKGVAGHAMEPQKGENAVYKLFLFLDAYKSVLRSPAATAVYEYLSSPLAAEKIGIACCDDKSGDLTLNLGTAKKDGDKLVFEVNLRLPLCAKADEIPGRIAAVLPNATAEVISYSENLYVPEASPLVKTLLEVYSRCTGEPAYTVQTGGGTYARELPNAIAFGPTFPGEETNIHNADECMEMRHLDSLKEIYYEAVLALDKI